jgi:PIN domain nuclease of toxin-antitoxin system
MNYLLDTYTFIWAISEKDSLSNTARKILDNPDNIIFVSSITFWEISLKSSLGKLNIQGISPNELPRISTQTGFQLLPLSPEEGATYHNLVLTNHKDPFDRMLIWQAICRDFPLITKDKNMNQYVPVGLKLLW